MSHPERASTPMQQDLEWLHRFLNCSMFSPPPNDIKRAHQIVDSLASLQSEIGETTMENSEAPSVGKLSRDYYRPIEHVRIHKTDYARKEGQRIERAIRLYSAQYGSAWYLQVRAPLGIGSFGGKDGKDDVVASASLSVEAMKELRDAITALLRDCGQE